MPKVEIEESDLAAYQRVNAFAEAALKNPNTRRDFLKVQKTLNPEMAIPELDAADQVRNEFKPLEEKLEALTKQLTERDTKREEDERTRALAAKVQAGQEYLTKQGYNAEGITKIEALMIQENIGSYAAGLALFERLNPPASPSDMSRTSRWGASLDENIQSADDYKALWDSQGQDPHWLEQSIAKVRSEFRN